MIDSASMLVGFLAGLGTAFTFIGIVGMMRKDDSS